MTQWTHVHLMFCEGPHDAAFLNRLLRKQLGFTQEKLKVSELPYPVSNVLQQSIRTLAADDLRLDLAKKFFLPDYLLTNQASLAMLFNYGGSNRKATMPPFLDNVFTLLGAPTFSGTNNPAERPGFTYTIFTDADTRGINGACRHISRDLATIGDAAWLGEEWTGFKGTQAVTQNTAFGPAAAYIWKKWGKDTGTLEDILWDCLSSQPGLLQTLEFLDARFDWKSSAGATPDQVCASAAKRLKAAFCVEGQHDKPGMSLGVILDQTELLNTARFDQSESVRDCVDFLSCWLGGDA